MRLRIDDQTDRYDYLRTRDCGRPVQAIPDGSLWQAEQSVTTRSTSNGLPPSPTGSMRVVAIGRRLASQHRERFSAGGSYVSQRQMSSLYRDPDGRVEQLLPISPDLVQVRDTTSALVLRLSLIGNDLSAIVSGRDPIPESTFGPKASNGSSLRR